MKETIFTAILLSSGFTYAAPGDLVFGVANTTVSNRETNVSNLTESTVATIGTTGYVNYAVSSAVSGADGAVGLAIASATHFELMATRSSNGYSINATQTQAAGLTVADGFTMGLNYINAGSGDWKILAEVGIGTMGYSIQNPSTSSLTLQQKLLTAGGGHTSVSGTNAVSDIIQNTLTSVFLTGAYNNVRGTLTLELHVYDSNGDLIGSSGMGTLTGLNGDEALSFQTRGYGATKDDANLLYANFGVWEGAAVDEQMSQFASDTAQKGYTVANFQAIPEPTSATLSVLVLAGLLARRRRQNGK